MKKVISLIMVVLMITSILPMSVFAEELNQPVLTIESADVSPGTSFDVNVNIKNNPGIISAVLRLTFDEGLTLVGAKNGNTFSTLSYTSPNQLINGGKITSGCQFMWSAADIADKDIKDGTIITLTFEMSEDAEIGDAYNIQIVSNRGDFLDKYLNEYVLSAQSTVTAVDYTPGDVNDDGAINMRDIVEISRYIVDGCQYDPNGYAVRVNENAANVNGDSSINMIDVVWMCRYIVDGCKTDPEGYNIKFVVVGKTCSHSLEKTEEKEPTCTEEGNIAYWQCTKCKKYFADENANSQITAEDVVKQSQGHNNIYHEATDEYSAGTYCDKCDTWTSGHEKIEVNESSISYRHYIRRKNDDGILEVVADNYLSSHPINNPNPSTYIEGKGVEELYQGYEIDGNKVSANGYTFVGWFEKPEVDANRVYSISASERGNKILHGIWTKDVYEVQFDSPDIPVEKVTYSIDKGITLTSPKAYGYTFVGWSNDNGFIVDSIKPGTYGNIRLHANWTSNRNKATSYGNYGEPIIIEDSDNGQFLFVYDIGRIDNVPLYPYLDETGNTIGTNGTALNIDMEYQVKEEFSESQSKEVIEKVADATTRSSGWTLSEEWEEIYSEGEEASNKQVKSEERTDSQGNTVGGNYFVSNSKGGSSFVSTESGGSSSNSSKVTTENSFGINASYDESTEKYCDATLGVENKTEVGAEVGFPVEIFEVGLNAKNTTTIGAEVKSGRKDNTAFHIDGSVSGYVGTVDTDEESSYYSTVANESSTWNSTHGYEQSYETSIESTVSEAIAQEIGKTTNYNISQSLASGSEYNSSVSGVTSKENGYSNSLQVSEYYSKTTTKRVKYQNPDVGYYRVVMAGTVHVYGVVGYDVATASYYTYTYNVLADNKFEYLDYSKERATFDDCENGVVTFEIPYEVNEYILGVTGETKGLKYGTDEGNSLDTVTKFNPVDTVINFEDGTTEIKPFDGTVVIPQYQSADNTDGTRSAIKVTKIASSTDLFKGKTNIKKVILPLYVTEIPDGAFEGCTNLETVIAYGVTKIGANAFKGCTSLKKFAVDNHITEIGNNAFDGVNEISVMAANSKVVDAVTNSVLEVDPISGEILEYNKTAKNVTLNLSKMTDSYDNKKITILDSVENFTLISDGREYSNLQIDSNATRETFISNMIISGNNDTPIKSGSKIVSLGRVQVNDAPGFALILTSDDLEVQLYGNNTLSSTGENAVISKSAILTERSDKIDGKLTVNGNYLIYGTLTDNSLLTGNVVEITEDQFNSYLTSSIITFDPNQGIVSEDKTTKTVYYGQIYGELPVPTRENYTFDGWYTEKDSGTKITAETAVTALVNQTLYARWTPNKFTLTYNANGGSVSPASKELTFGDSYGTLPTPKRDYYTFLGWYTAASGGTQVSASTTPTSATNVTIYAQWKLNDVKGWVKASEMPAGAQVTDTKWTYTLREYTESGSSSLSGWIKYDTKRTSWGGTVGPVYSDPSNGARNVWSEQYVTSSNYKTVYKYWRYAASKDGTSGYSYQYQASGTNYYEYVCDSRLPYKSSAQTGGVAGYGYTVGSKWILVWECNPCEQQQWVSDNYGTRWYYQDPVYTYYFYRDLSKESTSDPTNWSNTSNEVKWVMYRAK